VLVVVRLCKVGAVIRWVLLQGGCCYCRWVLLQGGCCKVGAARLVLLQVHTKKISCYINDINLLKKTYNNFIFL